MKYYFNMCLKKIFKLLLYENNSIKLGRWCHKGVKNCDKFVINLLLKRKLILHY